MPNKTNTFQGNPLPDVLLMSMKLPNVDEDVVGASLEGKDEAEHPQSHVFKYDFGGELVRFKLGVKDRNMKMDFNTGGAWHRVGQ